MVTWLSREALDQPAILESISLISACNQTVNLLLARTSQRELGQSIQDMLELHARTMKSLRIILQTSSRTARTELTILVIGHLLCLEVRYRAENINGMLIEVISGC